MPEPAPTPPVIEEALVQHPKKEAVVVEEVAAAKASEYEVLDEPKETPKEKERRERREKREKREAEKALKTTSKAKKVVKVRYKVVLL